MPEKDKKFSSLIDKLHQDLILSAECETTAIQLDLNNEEFVILGTKTLFESLSG